MQSIFQKNVDNAVSKTVNLSEKTTSKQIGDIFILAWTLGCKGVTVFREGCRAGVLESTLDDTLIFSDCPSGKCDI